MRDKKWDDYRGDVIYDTWRAGCNPDAVDDDHLHEAYCNGDTAESAAAWEIHRQEQRRREAMYARWAEEEARADYEAQRELQDEQGTE